MALGCYNFQMHPASLSSVEFLAIALRNPVNTELLHRLRDRRIPQCYLTAGCLFQAIWNHRSGTPVDWGVNDYDVFYFDDSDLTEEAEDRVIQLVSEATADLGAKVEVRNRPGYIFGTRDDLMHRIRNSDMHVTALIAI